jgi:hypothetical protein
MVVVRVCCVPCAGEWNEETEFSDTVVKGAAAVLACRPSVSIFIHVIVTLTIPSIACACCCLGVLPEAACVCMDGVLCGLNR